MSYTDEISLAFCNCSLPKAEWTHHAHLRVGLWHLLRYPPDEAIDRLRDRIRRYNVACDIANTEESGYHESITRFYVWAITRFLASKDRTRPADELADELIQVYGDSGLPFRHWSKDRLLSAESRHEWVEPDLEPLA